VDGCRPAKNMPPGHLDGQTARIMDEAAQDWAGVAADLDPLPTEKERNTLTAPVICR
jgi:hypothetical protein